MVDEPFGKIHVGDVGTQFIPRIKNSKDDGTSVVENISTAQSFQITWTKPDGTEVTKTDQDTPAVGFFTDGIDGKLSYVNKNGAVAAFDIDQKGYWLCRAKVTLNDGKIFESDDYQFLVRGKRRIGS